MINIKKIKNETSAIFNGAVGAVLISEFVIPVTPKLLLPWLAGRQAGLGSYNIEKGGDPVKPIQSLTNKNSFEGYCLRNSLNNIWEETKGVGKSLAPLILSIATLKLTGTKINIAPELAIGINLSVHTVGGYLLSRHHAKNSLAPSYAPGYGEHCKNNVINSENNTLTP